MTIRIGEGGGPGTRRDFSRLIDKCTTALFQVVKSGSDAVRRDYDFRGARNGTVGAPQVRVQHERDSAGSEKGKASDLVLQIETRSISIECDRFRQV